MPQRIGTPMDNRPSPLSNPSVQKGSLPAGRTSFTPSSTPPMTSAALQSYYFGQNAYRAPAAPMATFPPAPSMPSPAPVAPVQQLARTHTASINVPSATAWTTPPAQATSHVLPSHRNPTLRAGLGAFAPQHTEQQWAGEVRSATPPSRPASAAPLPRAQSAQQHRKAPTRPTPAQYDGAIDLTSDDEQERQDLLSSFKAKALAVKQAQASSIPASTPVAPSEGLQRFVFNHNANEQSIPVRENNPYARYQKGVHDQTSGL